MIVSDVPLGGGTESPDGRRDSGVVRKLANLRTRADLSRRTRQFLSDRGILEVETPQLAAGLIVDAHIDPVTCIYRPEGAATRASDGEPLYLQPSPEAPMKRLLTAGSGAIYQLARVFRDGESGRLHNPEFTMLEWYRPGFDLPEMIAEVGEYICAMLGVERWTKRPYREAFHDAVGVDPLDAPTEAFAGAAKSCGVGVPPGFDASSRNAWLDFFMSTRVEETLGRDGPECIYGYPPSQAALAQIAGEGGPVAERFEFYVRGIELCNGYHELVDVREHQLRFEEANMRRAGMRKEPLPVDQEFMAALERGLPNCSGVALGFDRLAMLACGASSVGDVIAFPYEPYGG